MVKFPYKEKAPFKLDLVPMINIVFLLLIFFMLTATTPTKEGGKVELPKAKTGEKSNKHYLTVTIDKKGALQLEGNATTLDALRGQLEKIVSGQKDTVISIHADKIIEFELFGQVIELAKQAGVEDFILATEQAMP